MALETAANLNGTALALGLEPSVMRLDGDRWDDVTSDAFPDGGVQPFATSVAEDGKVELDGRRPLLRPPGPTRASATSARSGPSDDGWAPSTASSLHAGQIMDVTRYDGGFAAVGLRGLRHRRPAHRRRRVARRPDVDLARRQEWTRMAAQTARDPDPVIEVFADSDRPRRGRRGLADAEASSRRDEGPAGGPGTRSLEAVAPLGKGFIAVGVACCRTRGEPIVVMSADGTTSPTRTTGLGGPGTQRFRDVCVGPDDTAVAVGISGTDGNYDAAGGRAPQPGAWSAAEVADELVHRRRQPADLRVRGQRGGFVAVGSDDRSGDADARVWTSTDGIDWRRVESGLLRRRRRPVGQRRRRRPRETAAGSSAAPTRPPATATSPCGGSRRRRADPPRRGRARAGRPGRAVGDQPLVDDEGVTIVGDDYGRVGLWQSDTLDR